MYIYIYTHVWIIIALLTWPTIYIHIKGIPVTWNGRWANGLKLELGIIYLCYIYGIYNWVCSRSFLVIFPMGNPLEMGFIYCQNVPGSGGRRLHWIQTFCKNTWHRNRKCSMTHIFLGYRIHHGSTWAATGGRSSISEVSQKTWLVQSVALW